MVTEVTEVVEEERELELREALPKFRDPKGRDWEGRLIVGGVHEGSIVSAGGGTEGVWGTTLVEGHCADCDVEVYVCQMKFVGMKKKREERRERARQRLGASGSFMCPPGGAARHCSQSQCGKWGRSQ